MIKIGDNEYAGRPSDSKSYSELVESEQPPRTVNTDINSELDKVDELLDDLNKAIEEWD